MSDITKAKSHETSSVKLLGVSISLQTLPAGHEDDKVCHRFEIDVACFVNRQRLAEETQTRDAFAYGATSRRRLRSAAVQPIPCHVSGHMPCVLFSSRQAIESSNLAGLSIAFMLDIIAWESSAKVPR